LLRLDASKARAVLGWRPRLTLEEALAKVVDWHTDVGKGGDAREITLQQLTEFGSPTATMTGQVSWA
jgi:CDP-glucose 4,6-dehydratase